MATSCAAATLPGMDALRWQRRVVLISAPDGNDVRLLAQQRALAAWRHGAADRDVVTVVVAGNTVDGASDAAAALRERYALPPDRFSVLLIGKDGHVAVRSGEPVDGAVLASTIDAMPLRRAGKR